MDAELQITFVNQAATNMLGYDRHEVIGRSVIERTMQLLVEVAGADTVEADAAPERQARAPTAGVATDPARG